MKVNDNLAADPIDVVATFAAQRPRHRRECARVGFLAVVFVSADVAILARRGCSIGTSIPMPHYDAQSATLAWQRSMAFLEAAYSGR
jgi:hypothetical protein